jgi:lia operon protein LiaG
MEDRKLKKIVVITAIIAAVAITAAAVIGLTTGIYRIKDGKWGIIAIDEENSFSTRGIDMIDLHTVSADIRTHDTASEKIEVHLTGATRARQQENIPYLSAGQKDSVLDIHIERRRKISAGFHENHLVLDIGIPRGYQNRLTVKTVSGDVTLTGHNYAGLALTTTSGDMELKQIQSGLFRMKTTSGTFIAEKLVTERSELSSVSGDIYITSFLGEAGIKTTSGDITLDFINFFSPVNIKSTSGDVSLTLPESSGFHLDARSTSGDITCGFPIQLSGADTGSDRRTIRGNVGSASNKITVRTVSGEIEITF